MRKSRLHTASIVVGSILAFTIAFSQFVTLQCPVKGEKAKTEQTGNTGDDQTGTYISLPSFSLPVPVSVHANLDAYCLFEIFFTEERDNHHVEEGLIYIDRLLETVFTVLISPNAP